jgi:DNA-binding transcriptional LysR family regulator
MASCAEPEKLDHRVLLDAHTGELVRVFDVQTGPPPHAYYAVYEKPVLERPEVALFLQWMRDTCKAMG